MTTPKNEENSLRAYLESQIVDPIQRQLNKIHLQYVHDIDQGRLTDEEVHYTRNFVQQQRRMGTFIPRVVEEKTAEEIHIDSNRHPWAWRIGGNTYQRFTMKRLWKVHQKPERKLTFPHYNPSDPMSPGYIHRVNVSSADQAALNKYRDNQNIEHRLKAERLAALRPTYFERVGGQNNSTIQTQIHNVAHPLATAPILNEPVSPYKTLKQLSRVLSQPESTLDKRSTPEPIVPQKRKTPPTPDMVAETLMKADGNNSWKRKAKSYTIPQIKDAIFSRYSELTPEEMQQVDSLTSKASLHMKWDSLREKYEKYEMSPLHPRYLAGASSSTAPPLEQSLPTAYAERKRKGKGRG